VFDPCEDLPSLRRRPLFSFGASVRATEAWCEHWPDAPLPALGERTPRQATRRERGQLLVEALLREFEHDADLLTRRGLQAPDVGRLRRELQMPVERPGDGTLICRRRAGARTARRVSIEL
jgi:hypothetical protein